VEQAAASLEGVLGRDHAPRWPRMRAILEGDVVYRSLQLARGGAEALFADLEPRVRWPDGVLYVDAKPGVHEVVDVAGRGLPLMPDHLRVQRSHPGQPRPAAGHRLPGPAAAPPSGSRSCRARRPRWRRCSASAGDAAGAARPPLVDDGARRPAGRHAERRQPAPAALSRAGLLGRVRSGRTVLYARTPNADAWLGDLA
jgi:hypothetical protein